MELHHVRTGRGEPLVLLHAVGTSRRLWKPVLGRLAAQRDCWALDLPGFGGSPPLAGGWEPSPAGLAAAVASWMRERGPERFHVAGNSLGGGVGLELARAGIALSVCAISPIGFTSGLEAAYLRVSLDLHRIGTRAAPAALSRSARARRLASLQAIERADRMVAADYRDLLRGFATAPGWRRTLPHLIRYRFAGPLPEVPVTVAWGDRDRLLLFGPQSGRARAALPAARHVTLAGCNHLPQWDDPAQVARVILDASAGAA